MQQLGKYVVTLITMSLICGMLLSLFQKGRMRSLLRFVCGVFLTIIAVSPLTNLSVPDLSLYASDYLSDGEVLANQGENIAAAQINERIKNMLEAYILDKATAIQAEIAADVILDTEGIPESVILSGKITADAQQKLTEVIAKDLGIPKEKQQWIG